MQPRRWSELYLMTGRVAERLPRGGRKFSDRVIALTLLWAAFNHRPISWATQRRNWPVWMQRLLPEVPTSTTMSRRLRAPSIRAFMDELLQEAQGPMRLSMIRVLDGTAFEIRGHSQDRQAGYGFGTSRKSKGYKLHVLLDAGCGLVDWRIAPMNVSEQAIAERMLLGVDELLYVVGDGGYDSRFLYQIVRSKGGQMVAPRQRPGTGLGHQRKEPGRLRSIALIEGPSPFGRAVLAARKAIERFFGNADSHAEALGELPAWVRTHRRVERWVHAKLIINAVRIALNRQAA